MHLVSYSSIKAAVIMIGGLRAVSRQYKSMVLGHREASADSSLLSGLCELHSEEETCDCTVNEVTVTHSSALQWIEIAGKAPGWRTCILAARALVCACSYELAKTPIPAARVTLLFTSGKVRPQLMMLCILRQVKHRAC